MLHGLCISTTIINYAPSSTKALPLWTEIDQYDAMTDRIIEVPYFNPFPQKLFMKTVMVYFYH